MNVCTWVVRGRQGRCVVGTGPQEAEGDCHHPLSSPHFLRLCLHEVFAHGFWRAGTMSSLFGVPGATVGQTEGTLSEEGLNI